MMEKLLKQYKISLKDIKKKREQFKEQINCLQGVIKDKRNKKKDRLLAKEEKQLLEAEDIIYAGMESDLLFAIDWMKTGKNPGNRRAIERRSVYQNTKPVDPVLMQRYFRSTENCYEWDREEKEYAASYSERVHIDDLLSVLTESEREIYLMKKGYALSLNKIADERGIVKSVVSRTLKRAEKKIEEKLLLVGGN